MNRLQSGNESDTSASGWCDEMGATADQLFVVSTYTDFERLGEKRSRIFRRCAALNRTEGRALNCQKKKR
jgi:hypothetical protein